MALGTLRGSMRAKPTNFYIFLPSKRYIDFDLHRMELARALLYQSLPNPYILT